MTTELPPKMQDALLDTCPPRKPPGGGGGGDAALTSVLRMRPEDVSSAAPELYVLRLLGEKLMPVAEGKIQVFLTDIVTADHSRGLMKSAWLAYETP